MVAQTREGVGEEKFRRTGGMIATALLFLDARLPGLPRILTSPYPSAKRARYPSIFLDQDFLDATKDDPPGRSVRVLEHYIQRLPPNLLKILTEAAIQGLKSMTENAPERSIIQDIALRLLQLLSQGDRPAVACEIVLDIVLNMPEASHGIDSW